MRVIRLAVICLLILASVPSWANDLTFSDGSFSAWTVTQIQSSASGIATATHFSSGGNPGEYIQIQNQTGDSGSFYGVIFDPAAVYNPANGAISSIGGSYDTISNINGNGQCTGFALMQGGVIYVGWWGDGTAIECGYHTGWTHVTWNNLASSYFKTCTSNGCPGANHPDFSSAGATITFGLATFNTGSGRTTLTDFDNFSLTLNGAVGVTGPVLQAGPLTPPVATAGVPFSNATVFHFTDSNTGDSVSMFAATIVRGDGTTVTVDGTPNANGQIVSTGSGGFDVQMSYTYPISFTNQTFSVTVNRLAGVNVSLFASSNGPDQMARDAFGNFYVGDFFDGVVNKITPTGTVTQFASGFQSPDGLAFDAAGNLYVANTSDGIISKVTPSGVVSTFASGFTDPRGLAFDGAGNLYVSNDTSGGFISKVTPAGAVTFMWATGLNTPRGLAFDAAGNLYAASDSGGIIQKVNPSGNVSNFVGGAPFNRPIGLAFDPAGNLMVSNCNTNSVLKVTPTSAVSTYATDSGLNCQVGIVFGSDGNLYVSNFGNNTISKLVQGISASTSASTTFSVEAEASATTTTVSCPTSVTYNGQPQTPCSATVTGQGLSQSLTVTYANNTFVGQASANASFAGDSTHAPSSGSATFNIAPALLVVTAGGYSSVYDGSAHALTACSVNFNFDNVTCTNNPAGPVGPDVGGASVSPVISGNTSNYSVTVNNGAWSITPRPVNVNAGSYSGVYDGAAHSPSACTSSYPGVSCTNNPNSVGPDVSSGAVLPVSALASGIAADYTITSTNGAWSITPSASVTSVTCPASVTYNGAAQTPCSASVVGINLNKPLTVGYTNNVNAGTATASAAYGGDLDHQPSSVSTQFTIAQAPTTITITFNPASPVEVYVPVTVTATVQNGSAVPPTGSINFQSNEISDSFSSLTCTLSNGSCSVTLNTVEPNGRYITGTYSGDANNLPTDNSSSTGATNLMVTAPINTQKECISAPFNRTAIAGGNFIWFNSVFQIRGRGITTLTHITFYDQSIQIGSGSPISLPDAEVTFDPNASSATTNFDSANQLWQTVLPTFDVDGKNWLGGAAYLVPSGGIPGGTKPVTWCGTFASDDTTLHMGWQWAAAVYTSFNTNYYLLGVKPVGEDEGSQYQNSDDAGTPENYKNFVIAGARGDGEDDFTGSLSRSLNLKK